MKRTYDLAFGMGAACACTECLRRAGLQFSSFPFDWLAGSTLVKRTDILVDGCEDWLRQEHLEKVFSVSAIRTDAYRNRVTDITFNHDFPLGVPLTESLDAVRAKYERRFARLRSLITRGGRVLVVYVTPPPKGVAPTPDEARYCRTRLTERFPNAKFDLLILQSQDHAKPQIEHPSDGIAHMTFDYRARLDPTGANPVDRDVVVAFLKHQGYTVRDYRTADERRRHAAAQRAKEYARFGAKGPFSYLVAKLRYKLTRHFQKHTSRKGRD